MTNTHSVPMYPLRVPDDIKERWKQQAKKKRMSLNQWIILTIEESQDKA